MNDHHVDKPSQGKKLELLSMKSKSGDKAIRSFPIKIFIVEKLIKEIYK
jgi:hypothetical protein